jgi:pimeloyl-ACP methyl ester carboxylesterase
MRRAMIAAALIAAASCAKNPAEPAAADRPAPPSASASVFPIDTGFVDANGVLIYNEALGRGEPEFVVDGNLTSVEYADRLATITVPTLITVGDHDEVSPSIAEAIHAKIPGSKLVILPQSGHMTFVDQPGLFVKTVADFVANR